MNINTSLLLFIQDIYRKVYKKAWYINRGYYENYNKLN